MDTLTLSQARTAFEQMLRRASIVAINRGASASAKQQAGPLAHQQRLDLVTLGNCLEQFDGLLADMEDAGLDAIPAGAAVCECIQMERQKVADEMTLYGAR
jgi:hypothetical protein